MRILHAPIHGRENTADEDNLVAHALRYAGPPLFDAVMIELPSRGEMPKPLDNAIVEYALNNAAEAGSQIIVSRHLWDYWNQKNSDADTPLSQGWYHNALSEIAELANHIKAKLSTYGRNVYTALNCEPMSDSPQLWLRDAWDESKRPAIDKAIRAAIFEAGQVHYVSPSTAHGPDSWVWSCAELGVRRMTAAHTYRMLPDTRGAWSEVTGKPPAGHAFRYDVRGLWVTAKPNGIACKTNGEPVRVFTPVEAMTCPEDSKWYCDRGKVLYVVKMMRGG